MPEHVHLLLSEPERGNLAVVLQMLKQIVSQKLNERATTSFWQPRYYDFNVWRESKLTEKLDYVHQNPVQRGLVARPEDSKWSSALHYSTGRNVRSRLNLTGQRGAASSLDCIRWSAAAMSAKSPALSLQVVRGVPRPCPCALCRDRAGISASALSCPREIKFPALSQKTRQGRGTRFCVW